MTAVATLSPVTAPTATLVSAHTAPAASEVAAFIAMIERAARSVDRHRQARPSLAHARAAKLA
jgi:hypothetical protein